MQTPPPTPEHVPKALFPVGCNAGSYQSMWRDLKQRSSTLKSSIHHSASPVVTDTQESFREVRLRLSALHLPSFHGTGRSVNHVSG